MKHLYLFLMLTWLISCQNNEKEEITAQPQEQVSPEEIQQKAEKAKKWLVSSIEGHFANGTPPMIMMTTPEYYEFKTDALNARIGLPGNITKEEFTAKWKEKFDMNRPDIFNGYLIPTHDFGRVKVKSCEFDKLQNDTLFFNVQISDVEYKTDFNSVIKLKEAEKDFLIADQIQL